MFVYVFIWSISPIFMKSQHPIVRVAKDFISLNSFPFSVFLYHFQLSFDAQPKVVHFRTLFWPFYIGLTCILKFSLFAYIYFTFRSVIRHAGSEQGTQAIPKFFSKPAVLATGISAFPSRDYRYGFLRREILCERLSSRGHS